MVFRIYECMTKLDAVALRFNLPVKKVWECDMLENKECEIDRKAGAARLDFKAFEIRTIRVSP